MKKLARGRFARVLSVLALISLLVPSFLLPTARVSAESGSSRSANILLLPVSSTVDGLPSSLTSTALSMLRDALQRRYGVHADILTRSSSALKLVKSRLADEAQQKLLMSSYDTATNPKASDEERANAAALLAAELDYDQAVFGDIGGYKMTSKGSQQREILMTASSVTFDKDANGKRIVDANGMVKPFRTSYLAKGRSKSMPGSSVSVALIDQEALADATETLATRITGKSELEAGNGQGNAPMPAVKEESHNPWLLPLVGIAALIGVAVAGGGKSGGSGGGPTPPTPTLDPPTNLTTQAVVKGSQLEIVISWEMPAGSSLPLSFQIFRTVGATMIAPLKQNLLASPNNIKASPGRTLSVSSRLATAGRFRDIHPSRHPMPLADSPAGTPYVTIPVGTVGLTKYTYTDTAIDYGQTYTYAVYAIYASGSSVPAMDTKAIGSQTPEVTALNAVNQLGTIQLTWTPPSGVATGTFKVYRSTASALSGVTSVSSDELTSKGFTVISPTGGLSWSTTSYDDNSAVDNIPNYYIVVWLDASGKASTGPYTISSATPVLDLQVLFLNVISNVEIDVNWTADAKATNYRLERTTTPQFESTWAQIIEETTLTYKDAALTAGTRYYYRLKALKPGGWVILGDTQTAMTFPDAAEFVNNPKPVSYKEVDLSWSGVTGATYYLVQRADDGGAYVTISTVSSTGGLVYTFKDTDQGTYPVVPGAATKYRIIASNDLTHKGPDGLTGTKNTEAAIINYPGPVTDLTMISIFANELDSAWTPVHAGTGATVNYKIERVDDAAHATGNWPIIPLVPTQSAAAYADKTLLSSTTYWYRITSMNPTGNTISQDFGPFTTYPLPAQIVTPITVLGSDSVLINYYSMRGSSTYTIQRHLKTDDPNAWVNVPSTTANPNPISTDGTGGLLETFTDTNLLSSTTYVYRVVTSNLPSGLGSGSTPVEVTTAVAASVPPTFDSVTTISENELDLTWEKVTTAASYDIFRSTDGINFPSTPLVKGYVPAVFPAVYKDLNLGKGTKYWYYIRAVNAGGKSDPSLTLSGRTMLGKVVLTATPINGTTVNLSWTKLDNTVNYIVEKFSSDTGAWGILTTITGPSTLTTQDGGCKAGNTYKYRVTASLDDTLAGGEASDEVVVITKCDQPAIKTLTADSDTSITLTWGTVNGATGYRIERSTSGTDPWTDVIDNTPGLTYTDSIGLSASTTYYYRVTAVIFIGGVEQKTATSDPSPVLNTTTKAGPKAAAYTISLANGKTNRIYFSDRAADILALGTATRTEYVLHGTKADGSLAAGALVTLHANRGNYIAKTPDQTVTTDGQFDVNGVALHPVAAGGAGPYITGLLDTNGDMTVIFLGRAEDNTAGFKLPTPATDLGNVTMTAATYGLSPITVAATPANQPVFVGPPATIVFSPITQPVYPVTQPNEGMPVFFQKDTVQITATVKDAMGQPVLAGSPIWFAQSWVPLTSLDATTDPDYNHKAVGAGNYSLALTQTSDATGTVSTGFTSNHSGVYNLYAFATLASKNIDATTLSTYNTDAKQGGISLPLTVGGAIDVNLLHDSSGNPVMATTQQVLAKTYAYYNSFTKVNSPGTPQRIYYNGKDSATLVFTAKDSDGKRVVPGSYFKATALVQDAKTPAFMSSIIDAKSGLPIPAGLLQDTNNNNINGTDIGFDEKSQVSMLYRGVKMVGIAGVQFDTLTSNGATTISWQYRSGDLATLYCFDLNKILGDGAVSFVPSPPTPPPGTDLFRARLRGSSDPFTGASSTPLSNIGMKLTLIDTYGNNFPANVLVEFKGGNLNINFDTKLTTDTTGIATYTPIPGTSYYTLPPGTDGEVDPITVTASAPTETTTSQSRSNWTDSLTVDVMRPHGGAIVPNTAKKIALPFKLAKIFTSAVTSSIAATQPIGFPVNTAITTNIGGITSGHVCTAADNVNCSLGAGGFSQVDTTNGMDNTLPPVTMNTGTMYGVVRLQTWFDKNPNNGIPDWSTEVLGDSGDLILGLPTPTKITATPVGSYDANGLGQIQVGWLPVPSSYQDGFLVEYFDGTNWVSADGNLTETAGLNANSTSYTITGLALGTTYKVRVSAVLAASNAAVTITDGPVSSLPSDGTANATTMPGKPSWGTLQATSTTNITVTWTAPTSGTVTDYWLERSIHNSGTWDSVTYQAALTYGDTGLYPGTVYDYRVRSRIKAPDGSYLMSPPVQFPGTEKTYDDIVPPSSLGGSVDASNVINLSWSQVAGNVGYHVQRSTDGVNYADFLDITTANQNWCSDNTATPGTDYYYKVATKGTIPTTPPTPKLSSYSNPVGPLQRSAIPATPTNFKVTAFTQTSVSFSWTVVAGMDYVISRSSDNWVTTTVLPVIKAPNVTADDNTVTSGTTYKYHIQAKVPGQNVFSPASADVTQAVIPGDPTTAPTFTSNQNSVTLNWTADPGATEYIVERSLDGVDFTNKVFTGIMTNAFTDSGLTSNTQYYYRYKVKNGGGTSGPSPKRAAMTAPDVPTGIAWVDTAPGAVKITWNISAGATSYLVELFDPNAGGGAGAWLPATEVLAPASPTLPYINITTLTPATFGYKVRISSKNTDAGGGTSTTSAVSAHNTP